MTVGQIAIEKFTAILLQQGLKVGIGPFNFLINTNSAALAGQLHQLYADYKLVADDIAEFHVQIVATRPIKKPFSPHIHFLIDGQSPFSLFPEEQALAALEWGINLSIAIRVNHLLLLHSAVVERNGQRLLAIKLCVSSMITRLSLPKSLSASA